MLKKVADFIRGANIIEIDGLNLNRLLDDLYAKGYCLESVARPSYRTLRLTVSDKTLRQLIVYLNSLCYNVNIIKRHSLRHSLKNLVTVRAGLLAGFVLAAALLISYNLFVWDIIIKGNSQIPTEQISQLLNDKGITKGALKSKINRKELSRILTSELEQASMVTVELRGVSILITIKERIIRPDIEEDEGGDEIISRYDGKVTRISVLSGTPLVKVGDIIKKGDVLIAAYEEKYIGSEKVRESVRAEGDVWAQVWITESEVYPLSQTTMERTGRVQPYNLFGVGMLTPKSPKKCEFQYYESDEYIYEQDFLIPLKITRGKYYELEPVTRVYTPEDIIEKNLPDLSERAEGKIPQGADIIRKYHHAELEGESVRIEYIITAVIKASKRS